MSKLSEQTNGIAISALKLQNLLWKHDGRTLDQYTQLPSHVQSLQTEFTGIGIFAAIGIILMLGLIITSLVVCVCRLGCNKCGGRKPRVDGYSNLSAMIISILITMTALVYGIMGGFLVMFTDEFGTGLVSMGPGALSVLTEVGKFQSGLNSNLTAIPLVVQDGVDALKYGIVEYNWTTIININLLNPVMANLTNITTAMDNNVSGMKSNMNNTVSLNDDVLYLLANISDDISWISNTISTYATVTIAGVSYPLTGLPPLGQLDSISLPDMSKTPNITKLQDDVNNIPNITNKLAAVSSQFSSISGNLSNTLNTTLNTMIPANIGSSLSFGGAVEVLPNATKTLLISQINGIFTSVRTGNIIRSDVYRAFYALSMLPWILALAGIVLRKRNFIKPLTIMMVIFGTLYWLQFIIFLILSVPLNDICLSYSQNTIFSTNLPLLGKSVNPKYIIDGCRDDLSLLQVSINDQNDKLTSFGDFDLSGILSKNITAIYQLIGMNRSSLLNADVGSVTVPNITAQFSSFSTLDLGKNVNLSSLNPIDVDLDDTAFKIQNFSDYLTLNTFNSNWDDPTFVSSIANFNIAVDANNNSWVSLTYASIVLNYIQGPTVFVVTETIPIPGNRAAIQTNWDLVLGQARFKYEGSLLITNMQSNFTIMDQKLNNIQNVSVARLNADMVLMVGNISSVLNFTAGLKLQVDDISSITDTIPDKVDFLIQIVKSVLVDQVEIGLVSTISNVVNDLYAMTSCKSLVGAVDELILSDLCINASTAANGIWFCCLILGFCSCVGFVLGLLGQKRVGNFYKPIKVIPV